MKNEVKSWTTHLFLVQLCCFYAQCWEEFFQDRKTTKHWTGKQPSTRQENNQALDRKTTKLWTGKQPSSGQENNQALDRKTTKHWTGKQPSSYSCLTDDIDFRFHHCSCDISSANHDLLSRNSTIPHGDAKWGGWSWKRFVFPRDQT